jgi:hypothetical protein
MVALAENSRLGQNFLDACIPQVEADVTADLHRDSGRCWLRPAAECTVDPIGFYAGDPNVRRYGGNSSILRVDPSGLDWLDSYANGFNSIFGSGYSNTVGGGIHTGLNAVGVDDQTLSQMTANQALAGTTVAAIPIAVGLVAGGEVLLGVGTLGSAVTTAGAAGTAGVVVTEGALGTSVITVGAGGTTAVGTTSTIVMAGPSAYGTTAIAAAGSTTLGTSSITAIGGGLVGGGTITVGLTATVNGWGFGFAGAGLATPIVCETAVVGSMAGTQPFWGAAGWNALNITPSWMYTWNQNLVWLYGIWRTGTPVLVQPGGGPTTIREIQWLLNHGYVLINNFLVPTTTGY